VNFFEIQETYRIVKYEWDDSSFFCLLDFCEFVWDLVYNLLLMEEKIRSSG